MKWLVYGLGAIVLLAGAVYAAGAMMPVKHSVSKRLALKQPPDVVWRAIADFPAQTGWRTGATKIVHGPDENGREVWVETVDGWEIGLATEVAEPPRRLVRRITGKDLAFGGVWTYEIVATDEGSTLTITEDGEVYSPVFRVMSKVMGQSKTIEQFMSDLARKFGEAPRIS